MPLYRPSLLSRHIPMCLRIYEPQISQVIYHWLHVLITPISQPARNNQDLQVFGGIVEGVCWYDGLVEFRADPVLDKMLGSYRVKGRSYD